MSTSESSDVDVPPLNVVASVGVMVLMRVPKSFPPLRKAHAYNKTARPPQNPADGVVLFALTSWGQEARELGPALSTPSS